MNRLFLLSFVSAAAGLTVACTLSQDLGGGSGSVTADGGQNGTSDSGQGSSGTIDSGQGSSGSNDSGTSSGAVDGGKDVAVATAACPTVPGYPAAPYMKFTFTGARLAGSFNTNLPAGAPEKSVVLAGHFTSTTPNEADYVNHFLVHAYLPNHIENGQFVGPEWTMRILTEETGVALPTGTPFPITIHPGIPYNGPGVTDTPFANAQTVADDKLGRYPGTGAGSCTMTVDFQQVGKVGVRGCLNARFTCTGLVGKSSGESFDLVDGQLSYASGSN